MERSTKFAVSLVLGVSLFVANSLIARTLNRVPDRGKQLDNAITCDQAADGTNAFYRAQSENKPLLIPAGVSCQVSQSLVFNGTVAFQKGSTLAAATGTTVVLDGHIIASREERIFRGAGRVVVNVPWVSVAWWGALVQGIDAAPAFRSAMGNDRIVYVPRGVYKFTSSEPVPLPAYNRAAVYVQNLKNLDVEGYGAVVSMGDQVANSADFHFYNIKNLKVRGFIFLGNRSGLKHSQVNAPLSLTDIVDFSIRDIKLRGNWGGVSAAVEGDWLVNGTFSGFDMPAVGQCFDLAFLKHVTFENFVARGADADGKNSTGHVGLKCVSVIYDTPLAKYNHTGIVYSDTNDVTIVNGSASNFVVGANIASGEHYRLHDNRWFDNPGRLPSARGAGVYIQNGTGIFKAPVGHAPRNIVIEHDQFIDNGHSVSGAGVQISSRSLPKGSSISGITIAHSLFVDNRAADIASDSGRHFTGVRLCGNAFEGPSQHVAIGKNLIGIAKRSFNIKDEDCGRLEE